MTQSEQTEADLILIYTRIDEQKKNQINLSCSNQLKLNMLELDLESHIPVLRLPNPRETEENWRSETDKRRKTKNGI